MLNFYEYDLPFHRPLKTGSGTFYNRKGIILRYRDGLHDILSEASPLPGFSDETVDDVKTLLFQNKKNIHRFLQSDFTANDVRNFLNVIPQTPSLQFSISFLAITFLAQRKNTTISNILGLHPPKEILVNDMIGQIESEELLQQIEKSVHHGFTTIKLKATDTPQELSKTLTLANNRFEGIIFRLDANQSWPAEKLREFSSLFHHLPVQYIEEPVRINHIKQIGPIQKECALPVALDESIAHSDTLETVLKNYHDLYVIIKPMLFGNILKLAETISTYRSTHRNIVFTTSLESKIGRAMTADLASYLGDKSLAHGLNTGRLFKRDLFPDLIIYNGKIDTRKRQHHLCTFDQIEHSLLKTLNL